MQINLCGVDALLDKKVQKLSQGQDLFKRCMFVPKRLYLKRTYYQLKSYKGAPERLKVIRDGVRVKQHLLKTVKT